MIPYNEFVADVALCQSIHKTYGKSFYAGTLFLSKPQRQATHILYAFFRFPDEYVDTYFSTEKEVALQKVQAWQNAWEALYHHQDVSLAHALGNTEFAILRATKYVFDTYKIPYAYSTAFLSAMIADTSKDRYQTYAELEQYMYGSASVVGLMMTHIICVDDPLFLVDPIHTQTLLEKADALGKAFQMTNFLRDIDEDSSIRGRVYVPQEDMERFGVTETDIINKQMSPAFIELMKYEIAKTRALYAEADRGICMLPRRASRGIHIARMLYAAILDKIEKSSYTVFEGRIHLSFIEKIIIAVRAIIHI